MREIVMDTETTGLDHKRGDRLIEIGGIELINRNPTGREYHQLINPDGREVHPDAERVHGISLASLQDKPKFADVIDEFLAFIGDDSTLVIHNANFDMGFINMELDRIGRPPIKPDRVVDTLAIARRKHPAGPNTLDALCKRYNVDNSKRIKHGAVMDSILLAGVYVELLGERQATLVLANASDQASNVVQFGKARQRLVPLPSRLTPELEEAHAKFVETLGPNAIWKKYLPQKIAAE